jgi:large subunit ribosomal protein L25
MDTQTLVAEARQGLGKGANRRLRRTGKLPGVVYGLGNNAAITVDPVQITKILMAEGGRNKVYVLKGGGLDGKNILVKDWQVDPVTRKLVHVDLQEIDVTKKVEVSVKITFTGKAAGVADGGVLNIIERTIDVKAVPTGIPSYIEIDVTALKIGESLHENDIRLPEGVELSGHRNSTIVTVVPPAKEEEATPVLTESATGPEVITEKKAPEAAAAGDKEKADDKAKK